MTDNTMTDDRIKKARQLVELLTRAQSLSHNALHDKCETTKLIVRARNSAQRDYFAFVQLALNERPRAPSNDSNSVESV